MTDDDRDLLYLQMYEHRAFDDRIGRAGPAELIEIEQALQTAIETGNGEFAARARFSLALTLLSGGRTQAGRALGYLDGLALACVPGLRLLWFAVMGLWSWVDVGELPRRPVTPDEVMSACLGHYAVSASESEQGNVAEGLMHASQALAFARQLGLDQRRENLTGE